MPAHAACAPVLYREQSKLTYIGLFVKRIVPLLRAGEFLSRIKNLEARSKLLLPAFYKFAFNFRGHSLRLASGFSLPGAHCLHTSNKNARIGAGSADKGYFCIYCIISRAIFARFLYI